MKRFRWFQAEWPIEIRRLASKLKLMGFDGQSTHGFLIDRVRDDFIEARYIEKIEYVDTVVDPFGNELEFERVEFRHNHFRISSSSPSLELIDPPRSVQPLMNRLSELVDFQVAIIPTFVDVISWAENLAAMESTPSRICSLQIGSLEIEKGVSARVVLKSDERDVRSASKDLTTNRIHNIEKAQVKLDHPSKGSILLANNGTALFKGLAVSQDIISSVRQSLIMSTAINKDA